MESKMENPTHSFKEKKFALQFIQESMSWSSRKKKEDIFCTVYFVRWKCFIIRFLSHCICALNIEYTYFYISKNVTSCTFVACFKNCRMPSVYP